MVAPVAQCASQAQNNETGLRCAERPCLKKIRSLAVARVAEIEICLSQRQGVACVAAIAGRKNDSFHKIVPVATVAGTFCQRRERRERHERSYGNQALCSL